MTRRSTMGLGRSGWLERACWLVAAVLVAPQLAAMSARALLSSPVTADWSASRLAAFERLSAGTVPKPIGYLELAHASFRIPVFSGTGETSLTLGAGHLPETGALNGAGNAAIAGHRDGFFRRLRKIRVGDELTLTSAGKSRAYEVTHLWVVAPDDVSVLDDTASSVLTLITCYPFYFVGHAPKRFVVRAVAVEADRGAATEL